MRAITLLFSTDKTCIAMTTNNLEKFDLPGTEVLPNKDPMLFAYEALKEVLGQDYIKTQLWFLKHEVCEGNCYTNINTDYYIAVGVINKNYNILKDSDYGWVPIMVPKKFDVPMEQANLLGYISEALTLFDIVHA